MKPKITFIGLSLITLMFLISACSAETQLVLTPTGQDEQQIQSTKTPEPTFTIQQTTAVVNTPTVLPSPTPTPRVHEVKRGETLGGIAWIYGVSLQSLIEMNEDVNINAMSVGTQLLIPSESLPPANQTPVPTPIQMPLRNLNCQEVMDGGIWCFMAVENVSNNVLESVSVNVNIADDQAASITSQKAFGSINLLKPGDSLPIAVYFPAPVPSPFQSSAQFESAIPLDDPASRYASITVENLVVTISEDQKSALVVGNYQLEEPVSQVRFLASAYDQSGKIIGLRLWQIEGNDNTGGVFEFQVYAAFGSIDRVDVWAEAQR